MRTDIPIRIGIVRDGQTLVATILITLPDPGWKLADDWEQQIDGLSFESIEFTGIIEPPKTVVYATTKHIGKNHTEMCINFVDCARLSPEEAFRNTLVAKAVGAARAFAGKKGYENYRIHLVPGWTHQAPSFADWSA